MREEGGHEHFDEDGVLFGVFGLEGDFLNFLEGEVFSPEIALEFVFDFDRESFGGGNYM